MPPPPQKDELLYRLLILEQQLSALQDHLEEVRELLRGSYVTQIQFAPVRSIVYGLVAIIMLSVVGTLVTLVLRVH